MALNNSSLFLGTRPILLLSESDEYPVIGPLWTLIMYGSLFICTNPYYWMMKMIIHPM